MKETDIAHLAGLIDGTGNISVRVSKVDGYKLGYTLRPEISIRRHTEDDPVLGKIVAYCDEYGVQYSDFEEEKKNGTVVSISVKELDSVSKFLEPLLPYLVTKYFLAEAMVEQIIPSMKDGKHREKEGFLELMKLVEEFRNYSTNKGKKKYDYDYFAEEWSVAQ